jgi:hypothetical protein
LLNFTSPTSFCVVSWTYFGCFMTDVVEYTLPPDSCVLVPTRMVTVPL